MYLKILMKRADLTASENQKNVFLISPTFATAVYTAARRRLSHREEVSQGPALSSRAAAR